MRTYLMAATAALSVFGGAAFADSIDPTSYSAELGVGESVTITKTVVVSKEAPTDTLLDVMFLIDTTGSMGSEIAAAKAQASSILTGLAALGDLESGVGFFNDPSFNGVLSDLTSNDATTIASINTLGASGGGDYEEMGNAAIKAAADGADWRPGSNRFIIVLGDAPFIDNVAAYNDDAVKASLASKGVELLGLEYGNGCFFDGGRTADCNFEAAIKSLGGTLKSGSTASIVDDIIDSVSTAIDTYTEVSVSELAPLSPYIDVDVECLTADIGDCVGDTAVGSYDRSVERTFTFGVTFTRLAGGDDDLILCGTVDGACVAREFDSFPDGVSEVPLPAGAWLLLAGLGGLAAMRRRKAA